MGWRWWYQKAEAVVDAVLTGLARLIAWAVLSSWTAGIVVAVAVVLIVATCSLRR